MAQFDIPGFFGLRLLPGCVLVASPCSRLLVSRRFWRGVVWVKGSLPSERFWSLISLRVDVDAGRISVTRLGLARVPCWRGPELGWKVSSTIAWFRRVVLWVIQSTVFWTESPKSLLSLTR